jgi:dsDNA-specific endonuclease/ATPase MutS2
MNIQQNELFKSGIKNISAAMDKLKLDGSLSAQEYESIKDHIHMARNNISALADVNPDHNGQFSTLIETTNFLERALNAIDPRVF